MFIRCTHRHKEVQSRKARQKFKCESIGMECMLVLCYFAFIISLLSRSYATWLRISVRITGYTFSAPQFLHLQTYTHNTFFDSVRFHYVHDVKSLSHSLWWCVEIFGFYFRNGTQCNSTVQMCVIYSFSVCYVVSCHITYSNIDFIIDDSAYLFPKSLSSVQLMEIHNAIQTKSHQLSRFTTEKNLH